MDALGLGRAQYAAARHERAAARGRRHNLPRRTGRPWRAKRARTAHRHERFGQARVADAARGRATVRSRRRSRRVTPHLRRRPHRRSGGSGRVERSRVTHARCRSATAAEERGPADLPDGRSGRRRREREPNARADLDGLGPDRARFGCEVLLAAGPDHGGLRRRAPLRDAGCAAPDAHRPGRAAAGADHLHAHRHRPRGPRHNRPEDVERPRRLNAASRERVRPRRGWRLPGRADVVGDRDGHGQRLGRECEGPRRRTGAHVFRRRPAISVHLRRPPRPRSGARHDAPGHRIGHVRKQRVDDARSNSPAARRPAGARTLGRYSGLVGPAGRDAHRDRERIGRRRRHDRRLHRLGRGRNRRHAHRRRALDDAALLVQTAVCADGGADRDATGGRVRHVRSQGLGVAGHLHYPRGHDAALRGGHRSRATKGGRRLHVGGRDHVHVERDGRCRDRVDQAQPERSGFDVCVFAGGSDVHRTPGGRRYADES